MQVLLGVIARPPKTSMVRRAWNLTHWTVGRAVLALAIADIFIGFYLSNVAHKHIIAQAVVLGGLFIIYMLKNDIEYLLVRISPAEEDRLLVIAQQPGTVRTHKRPLKDVSSGSACFWMPHSCIAYPPYGHPCCVDEHLLHFFTCINTCIYTTHCAYAGSKQFNVEMGDAHVPANGHTSGHANGHKASSAQNGVHTIV